jgi:hypothetical protein
MSAHRRLVAAAAGTLVWLSVPGHAAAFMDPAHAASDVDSALREGDYAFCHKPREPLSWEARALCPHAASIPACEGLAAACARTEEPRQSRDLPAWLVDTIGWLLAGVAQFVAWVLLPALVLALLWPAVRALVRLRRDRALAEPRTLPPPPPVDEEEPVEPAVVVDEEVLLERAERAARGGKYAVALELYLAAALRALDKRGAVKMSKDRTHGEYVRACTEAAARPSLGTLVREVDRVKFGREEPTEHATERAGVLARAVVQGTALVILALSLAACGDAAWPGPPRPGDDPAGQELLVDLLHRQGVRATPLDRTLSSLPLPAPGARTPAVIVDMERTELDDETRSHLLEWVDAGGSLVLAGVPGRWPKELDVGPSPTSGPGRVVARRLLARGGAPRSDEGDDDEAEDDSKAAASTAPVYASSLESGSVARGAGLGAAGCERVAWFEDGTTYAVVIGRGQGSIVGIASGELMANAALARPGNAAVLLAILSNADSESFQIAQPEDGVSPPSNPLAALTRAGLGLGLAHALVAAVVLFLAAGTRLHRPVAEPPPTRRAFVEHVEAVGALYRRTGLAAHALAAYTRFAEERLRARMPRGTADMPSFLASRASLPLDECQRVWTRATEARADAPQGGELEVLKELSLVYSRATDKER